VVTPAATAPLDTDSVATINGNFTVNLRGVRFYDVIFNSDELEYLN